MNETYSDSQSVKIEFRPAWEKYAPLARYTRIGDGLSYWMEFETK